jgi:hypothetical protein
MLPVSLDCPLREQSRMDNPETLATLSTQDTEQKKTLEKTEGAIKNGQSRDTDNIEYTSHEKKR